MVHHSAPSSPFHVRRFFSRRHLLDVGRLLGLALHLRRYVSLPAESLPTALRFEPDAGATILVRVAEGGMCEILVMADPSYGSRFGLLVDAARSIGRVRELRSEKGVRSPGSTWSLSYEDSPAAAPAPPAKPAAPTGLAYNDLLRRLGITRAYNVGALHGFLNVVEEQLGGQLVVPGCVMRQARDCAFKRPVDLAAIVTEVLRIHSSGPQGACDKATFGHLPGFRLNLSDTQLRRFRSDYAVVVDGVEYVGRLHCTLGSGFSPSTCASVHWASDPVRVVLTRIGEHGRNAQS